MTAPVLDLDGMPPPDNPEVTDRHVRELLDYLASGDEQGMVRTVYLIGEVAGAVYTEELIRRLNGGAS